MNKVNTPTMQDWVKFTQTHMPPPGTQCVIVGVRATNAYLQVTKGPYKGWLFTAELIYNDQCYKALPKYK